jgi:23S rRNA (guanine745-N1)-methyltransferase
VPLLAGASPHHGDSATMVACRAEFLSAGHYRFIDRALIESAAAVAPGLVVDAGAGTGAHLAAVLDARPGDLGLALDISKPALRRAARCHPRAGAVLADAWQPWPLAAGCAAVVLDVFAPRHAAATAEVLRPDGLLLVVTPLPDHLAELRAALQLLQVDPAKDRRIAAELDPVLHAERSRMLRTQLRLRRPEVGALVGMGPSARHLEPARLAEQISALPEPVVVTAAVRLTIYRRR